MIEAAPPPPSPPPAVRLQALDAFRGLIMLTLLTRGLFGPLKNHPNPFWRWLALQNDHVEWEGCVYWDLIQPSFMFMVGAAMPFAFARRAQLGDSWSRQFLHMCVRAFNLLLIGIVLDNIGRETIEIGFIRVLQQIAFGYFFAFFLLGRSFIIQGLACSAILIGYTLVWTHNAYNGPDGPWAMSHANIGAAFDHWMLSRDYNGHNVGYYNGFYVGLNAVPSTATILFGVMAGQLIQQRLPQKKTMLLLLLAGVGGVVLGLAVSPWVPLIKRIWTPSFAVFAGGCTTLMLLFFYWSIEVQGWRRWAFPLVVVGCNSLAAYCLTGVFFRTFTGLTGVWIAWLKPHLGEMWFQVFNQSLFTCAAWGVLYFFYRRKIFFKA